MKQRFTAGFMTGMVAFVIFLSGYWLGQSPAAPIQLYRGQMPASVNETTFAPFWEVWDLVHKRYFDQPLDDVMLTSGAIDGMLATLDDPNTRYLTPQAEEADRASMEGEIQGIGAEVTNENGNIVIVAPIEGSPAAAAGLRPGDILRQANGVDLTGMDVSEAARLVRGPAGTTVHLVIERNGESFEIDIVRDVIKLASVRGEMLSTADGHNLAYVRINRFAFPTAEELTTLLEELMPQNPSGLILDLRLNPGGSLETVVQVADQFLPAGIVLTERFGDGRETVYRSEEEGLAQDVPMVVLIDEGSASASEVLAGAIQDRGRGVLIGVTSFGKGTVQSVHTLSNGGGLRITVARWLTPGNRWVHEEGLTPDYIVPRSETDETGNDPQLQAAIDFLQGKPISGASDS
ncbi:MAG: S41 family peptidase [Candidatus Promineifilaceae bacterium]